MGASATLAVVLAIFTLTDVLVSGSPVQSSQQPSAGLEGLHELYEQLVAAANSNVGSSSSGSGSGSGSVGLNAAAPASDSYYGPSLLELLANRIAASGPSSPSYSYGLSGDIHQMVRKSNRTPSLRLRYGRSDPSMKIDPAAYQNSR